MVIRICLQMDNSVFFKCVFTGSVGKWFGQPGFLANLPKISRPNYRARQRAGYRAAEAIETGIGRDSKSLCDPCIRLTVMLPVPAEVVVTLKVYPVIEVVNKAAFEDCTERLKSASLIISSRPSGSRNRTENGPVVTPGVRTMDPVTVVPDCEATT